VQPAPESLRRRERESARLQIAISVPELASRLLDDVTGGGHRQRARRIGGG
jgi:hypothetical protein